MKATEYAKPASPAPMAQAPARRRKAASAAVGAAALVIRLPWAAEHGTSEGAWQIKRQNGANDAKRGALFTQTDAH
jgi:hypothetical protein